MRDEQADAERALDPDHATCARCGLPSCLCELGERLEVLTDAEREAVFSMLRERFCFDCGRSFAERPSAIGYCPCENDE